MPSLRECFDRHGCDRGSRHGYERIYEPLFEPLRNEPLRILEIGVFKGAGVAAWLEYFPKAYVTGIDTFQRIDVWDITAGNDPRALMIRHDSREKADFLGRYDLIFDDGNHHAAAQLLTFEAMKSHRNTGAMYFIEDVYPAKYDCTALFAKLPADAIHHDLRKGKRPDSYLVEVR